MGVVKVAACAPAGHQVAGTNLDAEQREALAHLVVAVNLRADFLAALVVEQIAADLTMWLAD